MKMFATPGSLKKRTGKADLNRFSYLKQLVEEYKSSETTEDKREQVLANLGNFAYDPINYEYFRRLGIIDLFMENLSLFRNHKDKSFNLKILNFSIAGICNLCLDSINRKYLLENDLINLMLNCLSIEMSIENIEIVLNILTVLLFMVENGNENETEQNQCLKSQILNFKNESVNFESLIDQFSKLDNKRISNLACLLLNDLNQNFKIY